MTRLAILMLACLAVVLGGVIAIEAKPQNVRRSVPPAEDLVRAGPVVPHGGDARQVQSWVEAILARPLFVPSRRPPAAAAGPGDSGPGFPRLTGIIIMPQQREAIFAAPGKSQPIVVSAGSRLNGVLIKSIDAGAIVVVDAAGARIIRPSFAAGTASGSLVPTAPRPLSVTVDQPPVPTPHGTSPFASIPGLSGRPLGLAAQPDASPPPGGGATNTLPSIASPGVSP
ncbi:hypothetical protein [Acidisoma sp.]|uniref:hypothetical protein n=1 Tax=Acidisoma sp. TaxID=1872115 RepID=UPI003AFFF4E7